MDDGRRHDNDSNDDLNDDSSDDNGNCFGNSDIVGNSKHCLDTVGSGYAVVEDDFDLMLRLGESFLCWRVNKERDSC